MAGTARPRSTGAPGAVRIIGGQWKRTPLEVIDRPGLRPTPDRVRETVFNWLGQDMAGMRVLDAFAGSGAFGFEAASRGAISVDLIERDRRASEALLQAVRRLGDAASAVIAVHAVDAIGWLSSRSGQAAGRGVDPTARGGGASQSGAHGYDVVFVDPPYGTDLLARALPLLGQWLNPGARVYVENDSPVDAPWLARMGLPATVTVVRAGRAGDVHYHLLEFGDAASIDGA